MDRRQAIKMLAAASTLTLFPNTGVTETTKQPAKLIWVILRGAQDGLSTLIPHNEPSLSEYRPTLWPKLKPNILKLTNDFSLHPKLTFLKKLYDENQLIAIPAVSTGYEGRSHFEGQDFMECGKNEIDYSSGWVGRLLNVLQKSGIAISPNKPFCMRGTEKSTNWFPSDMTRLDDAFYEEILNFYEDDETIKSNLMTALKLRKDTHKTKNEDKSSFSALCKSCGNLMTSNTEYLVATLELSGWDTHKNQHDRLNKKMITLNDGLGALKASLKNEWFNTTVIISTEFGRTVRENGTEGTDHGTASTMFITGGKIKKSAIEGTWPGIDNDALYKGRDLMPTSNFYFWVLHTILETHAIPASSLSTIFKDK